LKRTYHEHKYIIKDTSVRVLKTPGYVQRFKMYNDTPASLF